MQKSTLLITVLYIVAIFISALLFRVVTLKSASSPPSLYWEEVALGYDAYSLLKTGKDHHGNPWPIVALESFGDWKPTLYAYTLIPSVAAFGLTPWAIRLPALIAGLSCVLATMLIARQIGASWKIAGIAAAINPWLIHFSRAGWESMLATALISWAAVCYLWAASAKTTRSAQLGWVFTVLLLVLSMYTYHAARLSAPLIGLVFASCSVWIAFQQRSPKKSLTLGLGELAKQILPSVFVAFLLLAPLALSLFSGSNQTTQRAAETGLWADGRHVTQSNSIKEAADNSLISRVLYHRYLVAVYQFLVNFSSHFDLGYLFIHSDKNPRHSPQIFGLFYLIEVIPLLMGFWLLLHKFRWQSLFIFGWIVAATIPAGLTTAAPHALRTLAAAPAWILVLTLGWQQLAISFKKVVEDCITLFALRPKYQGPFRKLSLTLLILAVCLVQGFNLLRLVVHTGYVYPVRTAQEWQYGYQEMVQAVTKLESEFPDQPVYISREQGRPAMYYWFFTQTDPVMVQNHFDTAPTDQGESLQFENKHFVDTSSQIPPGPAIVATSNSWYALRRDDPSITQPTLIRNPKSEAVWVVYQQK